MRVLDLGCGTGDVAPLSVMTHPDAAGRMTSRRRARHRHTARSHGLATTVGQQEELTERFKSSNALIRCPMSLCWVLPVVRLAGDAVANAIEREFLERDRARLTTRLERARRMQMIGSLATGIAHNFNNIIGARNGGTAVIARNRSS
jgi:hypothetical protein